MSVFGNPCDHALWQDESHNRVLRDMCRWVHGANFEARLLAEANQAPAQPILRSRRDPDRGAMNGTENFTEKFRDDPTCTVVNDHWISSCS